MSYKLTITSRWQTAFDSDQTIVFDEADLKESGLSPEQFAYQLYSAAKEGGAQFVYRDNTRVAKDALGSPIGRLSVLSWKLEKRATQKEQ